MYVNADPEAGTSEHPGIGGATGQRIETRESIIDLFRAATADLEAAGAEVVLVDFPVVSNYEGDRPGAPTIRTRGLVRKEFLDREILDLSAWSWDDFLSANGDPKLNRLADVDGSLIWVHPDGALPDRAEGFGDDITTYPAFIREHPTDIRPRDPASRGRSARARGVPPYRPRRVDGRAGTRCGHLPHRRRRRPCRYGRR